MADTIQWNQQPFAKGKVYLTISTLLKSVPSLVEIVNLDLGLKDKSWKKTIKKEMKSNRTLLDIRKKKTPKHLNMLVASQNIKPPFHFPFRLKTNNFVKIGAKRELYTNKTKKFQTFPSLSYLFHRKKATSEVICGTCWFWRKPARFCPPAGSR